MEVRRVKRVPVTQGREFGGIVSKRTIVVRICLAYQYKLQMLCARGDAHVEIQVCRTGNHMHDAPVGDDRSCVVSTDR